MDPFRRLATSTRMWAAAALSLAPMGLPWSAPHGHVPGPITTVSQAPMRVLLAIATVGFLVAAARRTDSTRRLARVATAALGGSLALALSARLSTVILLLLTAALLAGPPVWRPDPPGLAPGSRAA
jgi:hypothetical protein